MKSSYMNISSAMEAKEWLNRLADEGKAANTIRKYYGEAKRKATALGINTRDWPKLHREPRTKYRDPIGIKDCSRIDTWLRSSGCDRTADLCHLIRYTGMRPNVEALMSPLRAISDVHYTKLTIVTGKGGHERSIPIVDAKVRAMLANPYRIAKIRATPYRTHADRLMRCTDELAIKTRLPTLHAFRHTYATEAYSKTKDREMVQYLLGHVSGDTTSKYIGQKDLGDMATELIRGRS